jgi:hypothetical protein
MRVAYLILAHDTPNHLKRLVGALNTPDSRFFIHVDRKSDLERFLWKQSNVTFLDERISIYWGDFSRVGATMKLIEAALQAEPDYCCLISGSDYPIRRAKYIQDFFHRNRNYQYLASVPIPCPERGKPSSRVQAYTFAVPHRSLLLRRVVHRLNRALPRRTFYYKGIIPYGGSQWWALTGNACRYIIDFARTHASFVKFFERVPCPDESFFHTIIGNSAFRERVVRNLTYCDWSTRSCSPAVLDRKHLDLLTHVPLIAHDEYYGSGELLFARKFPDDSKALVSKLARL